MSLNESTESLCVLIHAGSLMETNSGPAAASALPLLDPLSLPRGVAEAILLLVPVPQRLRCREVSRSWRALLAQPRLWRALDFSAAAVAEGVIAPTRGQAFLSRASAQTDGFGMVQAASAAAGGTAEVLDLTGCRPWLHFLWFVDRLVEKHRRTLRVLRLPANDGCCGGAAFSVRPEQLRRWLEAAPVLAEIAADVVCSGAGDVREVLDRETSGASGPAERRLAAVLRVSGLILEGDAQDPAGQRAALACFSELAEASAPWLRTAALGRLDLGGDDAAACAELLAHGVVRGGLRSLSCAAVRNTRRVAPLAPFARMLRDGRLRALRFVGGGTFGTLLGAEEPEAPEGPEEREGFFLALRDSRLEALSLRGAGLWEPGKPERGAALLGALAGHLTLRVLEAADDSVTDHGNAAFFGSCEPALALAGGAYARLLSANTPALRNLDLSGCSLSVEALGLVFDGLRANTHLVELSCRQNISWREQPAAGRAAAFAAGRVLPAVRACASLRVLTMDPAWESVPGAMEVDAVLAGRCEAEVGGARPWSYNRWW